MAYGLVRFAGSAGPGLFAPFLKAVAGFDLPPCPPHLHRRKYGQWADGIVRDRLSMEAYSRVFAVSQRISRMANRAGLNAFREAAPPPLVVTDIFRRWRSALPRALFLYLAHNATFVAGEAILSASSYWNSRHFFDCFECRPGVPLADVEPTPGFIAAAATIISRALDDAVEISVDRSLLFRGFPARADPVCALVIRFGDRSRPVPIWSRNGTEMLSVPRERLVVLIYDRQTGQLAMTGRTLGRDGFEEVAALFQRELLKAAEEPFRHRREAYDLLALLNNPKLNAPARSGVEIVEATGIGYRKNHVFTARSFQATHNIRGRLAEALGKDWVNFELQLIEMTSVDLRIRLEADEDYPKGRTIKVCFLRDRYVIEGGCHTDRMIVERIIDHLDLRGRRRDQAALSW